MLQAATLLPPNPEIPKSPPAPVVPAEAQEIYLQRLNELTQQPEVQWQQLEGLRPQSEHQRRTLIHLLNKGNRRQAKLAALLAAGTRDDHLSHALYAAATSRKDESLALACVLAPAKMPFAYSPAMAYLAQSQEQPLSVRAAAAGRLLENGYLAVWPLCRSIFRSGTAGDERPPWADWRRGARWELPKRVLLQSVNRWLNQNQLAASTIEPNAAWAKQLEQLAATEELVQETRKQIAPDFFAQARQSKQSLPAETSVRRLLAMARNGDKQAEWAIQWIRPQIQSLLNRELASRDAGARELARRILEKVPK